MIVGTGSGGGTVTGTATPNPSTVNFGYPNGTLVQFVNVTSNVQSTFNVSNNSTSGWLLVNGSTGASSISTNSGSTGNLLLSVNTSVAAALGTGSYPATVTLTNSINSADVTTMTVTLSVNGATGGGTTGGIAAPTSLSFAYQTGTAAPPCQNVLIASSGTFSVTPTGQFYPAYASITGPATIQVCAAVGGLSAGTSNGTLTIASSSSSQSIPLTLTVYASPI